MIYAFSGNRLDTGTHVLTRNNVEIPVEPQVFDVIRVLAENHGELVTKDQMIDAVWDGRIVSDATISARINAARTAVGDNGKDQSIIRTVTRRGFKMVAAVERLDQNEKTSSEELEQTIRYTTSTGGTSIAWSSAGSGTPLLSAWHHLAHLEQDWISPLLRPGFEWMAEKHRLIRYDIRGSGLSDPIRPGDTIDQHAEDMLAVADAAGLDRFPVLATLQAAAAAIRLAVRHPDRISCLVLQNGYARGRAMRTNAPEDPESDPFIALLNSGGWGDPDNGFMRAWATMVLPMATFGETTEFIRLIANSGTPEEALVQRSLIDRLDVTDDLARVRAPTLVIHARLCALHPVAEGRKTAAGIPNAEFLEVDSSNTIFIASDPVFERVFKAKLEFLDRHA